MEPIQQVAEQMFNRCLIRWRKGDRLGPTLREHSIAYFHEPSPVSIAFLKKVNASEHLKIVYISMVEAQKLVWASYSDDQARQVYDDWLKDQN